MERTANSANLENKSSIKKTSLVEFIESEIWYNANNFSQKLPFSSSAFSAPSAVKKSNFREM
ncbi:MAG: hypothetical protein EAZ93_15845 [Oscillatoriales cyanobacterium]|nr:MAG: hypothetical protein EAZ93_15845 [Oscillatoriales cyanobacterium]